MEKQGVPTITVATTSFTPLARVNARAFGMPDLTVLTVPHPLGGLSAAEVQQRAEDAFPALVDLMLTTTRPGETEAAQVPASTPDTVRVRGTVTDVYQEFYEKDWTDGLPIVPPTRERVARMLKGTSHRPEELVGELAPGGGAATVERVAVNAVMAGCRVEYFPVVLAAVAALADPENNMAGWATTTGANSPVLMINGPVRGELDINSGSNALGTGRRANATIGRAVNLVIRNIGGVLPGVTDMTTYGAAYEYTNCLAENEEALPPEWVPLNVERGQPAGTSSVTVEAINCQVDIFHHAALEFRQILDTAAASITGVNNLGLLQGMELVLGLNPEAAFLAAKDGWSKEDIRQYIFEKARQPLRDWKYLGDNTMAFALYPEVLTEPEDSLMRMIAEVKDIIIIVFGGPGKHSVWWPGGQGKAVTKSIDVWR
ncbi:MAG: hypothetical protein ABID87_08620 [Chloroflexota bacterium]